MYKRLQWLPTTKVSEDNINAIINSDNSLREFADHKYGYSFSMIELLTEDDFASSESISLDIDVDSPLILPQSMEVYASSTLEWWEFSVMIPSIYAASASESAATDNTIPSGKLVAAGLYELIDEELSFLAKVRGAPMTLDYTAPSTATFSPPGFTVCGTDIFKFASVGRKRLYVVLNTTVKGYSYSVRAGPSRPTQCYVMNMGVKLGGDYDV